MEVVLELASIPAHWRSKIAILSDGCWQWNGWSSGNGYGKVWYKGRAWMAHRAVYDRMVSHIGLGLILDHQCRNRSCVNPLHLRQMTIRENTLIGEAVLFRCAS